MSFDNKVSEEFKSIGFGKDIQKLIFEWNDFLYLKEIESVKNFFMAEEKLDMKRFIKFLKLNYFNVKELIFTNKMHSTTVCEVFYYLFKDNSNNRYGIEIIKNHGNIICVRSFKNKEDYRDFNKPTEEQYLYRTTREEEECEDEEDLPDTPPLHP